MPAAGAIADSAVGPGAADIARRVLTDDEIRTLIRGEADERRGAADQIASAHPDRAEALRAEAVHLETILCEV